MTRRWPTPLAARLAMCGLAGATLLAEAGAAEPAPAPGRVTALPGTCRTRLPDDLLWRSLNLQKPQVREGQRIRCQQPGTLMLELPGSGYETRVQLEPDIEYVVPLGQRLPATRLRPAARIAGVDEAQRLLPEPGQTDPPEGPTGPQRLAALPGAGEAEGLLGVLGAVAGNLASHFMLFQGATASRSALALETCSSPLGTVVITAESAAASAQMQTELASLARKSNCFVVAEAQGLQFDALMSRQLAAVPSGPNDPRSPGRAGVTVDYVLTPVLSPGRSLHEATMAASAAAGTPPGAGATATLKLVEARSGQQVAAAMGDSRRATATYLAALQRPASSVPPPEPALSVSEETARQLALLDAYNRTVRTLRQQQAAARAAAAQAQPAPAKPIPIPPARASAASAPSSDAAAGRPSGPSP